MFLPQALARVFFDKFVASMWHMMPYFDLNELEDLLARLYRTETGTPLDPGDLATILLVLANGATLTDHDGWVQDLAQRAKREVPELDEVVSIASIKINMLLAYYYASIGRANTSYIQGGIAVSSQNPPDDAELHTRSVAFISARNQQLTTTDQESVCHRHASGHRLRLTYEKPRATS